MPWPLADPLLAKGRPQRVSADIARELFCIGTFQVFKAFVRQNETELFMDHFRSKLVSKWGQMTSAFAAFWVSVKFIEDRLAIEAHHHLRLEVDMNHINVVKYRIKLLRNWVPFKVPLLFSIALELSAMRNL